MIDRETKILMLEILRADDITEEQRNELAGRLGLPSLNLHLVADREQLQQIQNEVPKLEN